jgi:hypothetical protein
MEHNEGRFLEAGPSEVSDMDGLVQSIGPAEARGRRRSLALLTVVAIALLAATSPWVVGGAPTAGATAASSCAEREWPVTVITCTEAERSVSLGMAVTARHIWLTTLEAVDARLRPARQVGEHPADPETPVWVVVYDGYRPGILYANEPGELVRSKPEDRVLHVSDATNPRTRDGAFVYIYGWSELGSPDLPASFPLVALDGQSGVPLTPDHE